MTIDPNPHSKIQPEIQFLRAVAVSLVILSHSKLPLWSGGFVGVEKVDWIKIAPIIDKKQCGQTDATYQVDDCILLAN